MNYSKIKSAFKSLIHAKIPHGWGLTLSLLVTVCFTGTLTPQSSSAQVRKPRQQTTRRQAPRQSASRNPPQALRNCWFDRDRDSYGDSSRRERRASCSGHWVTRGGDCNDRNRGINPGRSEVCGNRADDDCDGKTDENMTVTVYRDRDQDGYGSGTSEKRCTRRQETGYASRSGDCNDRNRGINPGRAEVCGNQQDDDCDGKTDENMRVIYRDLDGDGYGNSTDQRRSCTVNAGFSRRGGDCNDRNSSIHPGRTEIRGNRVDDNCDRRIDE